jgi:hypothetical protein
VCESGLRGRGSSDFRLEDGVGAVVKGVEGEGKGREEEREWLGRGNRWAMVVGEVANLRCARSRERVGEGAMPTSRPSNETFCKVK